MGKGFSDLKLSKTIAKKTIYISPVNANLAEML